MIVPLGNDVYVNPAHISVISAVMPAPNRNGDVFQLTLLIMGNREHVVYGSQANITALHARLRNALNELGP